MRKSKCVICGKVMLLNDKQMRKIYCSGPCQTKAAYHAARMDAMKQRTGLCKRCGVVFEKPPHANNKSYCGATCQNLAYRQRNHLRLKQNWDKRNEERQRLLIGKNAIPCKICGKTYRAPVRHAWQKHGLSGREYKEQYGLDVKRGILTSEVKEKHREAALAHNMDVLLPKWGERTRLKTGHKMRYKRSQETIKRLKKQFN